MPHFECGAFNHSATSPRGKKLKWSRPYLAAAPQRHKVAAGKVNQFHDLDGFSIARTWRHCRKRRGQSAEASKNSKPPERVGRSKPEALYVDLGKDSATITGTAQSTPPGNPTIATGRFDISDTMWIVRAGVNYKFGG
jgi:hypothetical protein